MLCPEIKQFIKNARKSKMAHNRKFVPGYIFLLMGRLRNLNQLNIQNDIEKIIIDSNFLENAPFKWVGLMYRIGLKNTLKPHYGRIDQKDGELPIAVEVKFELLKWADENDLKLLKDICMIAGLEALLHVGNKYNLPIESIASERAKYGDILESLEEHETQLKRTI